MSKTCSNIALMQVMPVPDAPEAQAPDWIHLLPAGETIATHDGRGPYRMTDAQAVIAASLQGSAKLPIDENHAIDLAAPRGEPAPARGHIVDLQARADGIWGRVEWTPTGRTLMAERAYSGISPAIAHDRQMRVIGVLRASLVNRPNLRGLTALHQEENMSLTRRLAELLGLDAEVGEDALVQRITALHQQSAAPAPELTALQSRMGEIGVALGVPQDADPEAIVAAVRKVAGGDGDAITALQAELTSATTALNAVRDAYARDKAEAWVDGEIRKGRVGIKPRRDYYISLHMRNTQEAIEVVDALPLMTLGGHPVPEVQPEISTSLQSQQDLITRARAYQAKLEAAGMSIDWPSAVVAVREGKQ
ncbi:phage protease [Halodurantibacterium flavum]|uniref:Phage protease n=1 Tax=Halodurantibacterium flavum TaxID=1382802 RepID=A0ABW4SBX1_9RHOB